jgi:hypothetical protein
VKSWDENFETFTKGKKTEKFLLAVKRAEEWLSSPKIYPLWQGDKQKKGKKAPTTTTKPEKRKEPKPDKKEATPAASRPSKRLKVDTSEKPSEEPKEKEKEKEKEAVEKEQEKEKEKEPQEAKPHVEGEAPEEGLKSTEEKDVAQTKEGSLNDARKRRGRPKSEERPLPEKEKFVLSLNKPKEAPVATGGKTRGRKKMEHPCVICKMQKSSCWQGSKGFICEGCMEKAFPVLKDMPAKDKPPSPTKISPMKNGSGESSLEPMNEDPPTTTTTTTDSSTNAADPMKE